MSGRHFGHFRRLSWPGGRYGRGYPYGYNVGEPYNLTAATPKSNPSHSTQQTDTLMIVGGMMFSLLLVILLLYRNQE